MILLIKRMVDWKLIRQQKQIKINKSSICKNSKRVYHDYKVGYKFTFTNNVDFRYKNSYNVPFGTTCCWTNGTVTLQWCNKIRHNMRQINPHISETNVEDT